MDSELDRQVQLRWRQCHWMDEAGNPGKIALWKTHITGGHIRDLDYGTE